VNGGPFARSGLEALRFNGSSRAIFAWLLLIIHKTIRRKNAYIAPHKSDVSDAIDSGSRRS
jgi:hypothetical protein